jgi:hypothetical protein
MPRATAMKEEGKPSDSRQVEIEDHLEDDLRRSLEAIKNPDGTGETKVFQKGLESTEFVQIGGPGYEPSNTNSKRKKMPDGIKRTRKQKEDK